MASDDDCGSRQARSIIMMISSQTLCTFVKDESFSSREDVVGCSVDLFIA
jgi:hypothetical protein